MVGVPIRRQQEAYLTEHEAAVFEDRAGGLSWAKMAKKYHTSCFVLDKWLKAIPERHAAWKGLDAIAAEANAGAAEEILEEATASAQMGLINPELTRLAIARSDLKKWHAAILDRARFGADKTGANVTINLGGLHLTAVRELNAHPPVAPAHLLRDMGADDAEYEVIEEAAPARHTMPAPEPTLDQLLYGDPS